MAEPAEELPSFPAPSTRSRVRELGYGSGPWSRSEFAQKWGDAMSNKVIADAKDAGWLVSPYRSEFFVPPAADLMLVSWLPPAQRQEFIISRTLAAGGLRFWSLSAWAGTEGLLFSEPLFVTDLSLAYPEPAAGALEPGAPRDQRLGERGARRSDVVRSLPFLESLIIVPTLGRLGDAWERSRVKLPEASKDKKRKGAASLPPGGFAATDSKGKAVAPNVIEYQVTRRMADPAWVVAFLTALNIPRARQELRRLAEEELRASTSRGSKSQKPTDLMDRALRWGASFGPPSPNENWQAILESGTYPYLLVPRMIWDESLSLASSRIIDEMSKLRKGLDA